MALWSERFGAFERIREYLESTTHRVNTLRHTHQGTGLPTPDRRPKVESRYMVTAYAGGKAVKSALVGTKEEALRFVGEWLEQGYVVRVEQ